MTCRAAFHNIYEQFMLVLNDQDSHILSLAWTECGIVEASMIWSVEIVEENGIDDLFNGYSPYIIGG